MDIYTLASIIMTLAVMIGYLNYRFVKMPTTIAIMTSSLLLSLTLIIIGQFGFTHFEQHVSSVISKINFHNLLINGMLSFLLFAGALTVDISHLKAQKWEITTLASLGTIISTILVGALSYYLLPLIGIHLSLIYCFLFGALISPTDPIAVLATFKKIGAPKELDVIVAGESLFNDGVGIVIFLTLYKLAFSGITITWQNVSLLFLHQAIGGLIYGIGLGYIAHWLIKPVHDHKLTIFITLLITTGGYSLAQALNISGPLAMVVAGIMIGNRSMHTMSEHMRHTLSNFWELIDDILNAILFLLIGFEILSLSFDHESILAALLAIPLVLLVRLITVATPMSLFKLKRSYPKLATSILVWGGLRGGLAVALALALPPNPERRIILSMTYAVVAFAIIVQGLSVKQLVKKCRDS